MPRPLKLRALPEAERRQTLTAFLEAIDRDPELAHFRRHVTGGPGRQLALLAAWERAVFRGGPAAAPPGVEDLADQLLCDVLELCDRDPELKSHGLAYGADRHKANLQALGAWNGEPRALELFTTAFSHLSADGALSLPALTVNCSPDPQMFRANGELIDAENVEKPGDLQSVPGIIHHAVAGSGEECHSLTTPPASPGPHLEPAETKALSPGDSQTATTGTGFEIAERRIRRGRPPALDDLAKGRLLGLMSHGLSFRQAAAQLGVHHVTVLNALKRDEPFAQQVAEARLDAISQPLLVVVQAARKNWRAAAWLARFLDGRRVSTYESTPEEREVERKRG